MNISKKRLFAAMLASGLLLGGTADAMQANNMEAVEEAIPTEKDFAVMMEFDESSEPTEGAPMGTLAVDPALRQFGLCKEIHQDSVHDGKTVLMNQTWTTLSLADGDGRSMLNSSNFPNLKGALEEYNHQSRQMASHIRSEMKKDALGELKERKVSNSTSYFHPYYSHINILVQRADAAVLSFIQAGSSFTNGVHGMYGFSGVNFAAPTGKRLALLDVFRNVEALPDIIISNLREDYPDPYTFYDNMDSIVTKSILDGTVNWTIGARGVTFYFNPYEIAPYACGLLTTTILFDERPGLFQEKYMQGPASYCQELSPWQQTCVSLHDDGRGKRDILRVGRDGEHILIELNGISFQDDISATEIVPVFVHTGNDRNYVYVDCQSSSNGKHELRIYDLNGAVPSYCGFSPFSFQRIREHENNSTLQWVMTDPYEFCMDERSPSNRGISKTHTVEIGSEGTPTFG